MRRLLLLLGLSCVGCVEATTPRAECPAATTASTVASSPTSSAREQEPEHPPLPREFVRAPEFPSSERLIQWLDAQARSEVDPLLVRVPLRFPSTGGAYSAGSARLGEASLTVDDSLLPEALSSQLVERCSARPQCTVSVVGYWRRRVDAPLGLTITELGAAYPESLPLGAMQVEIASTAASDGCANALVERAALSEFYGERHPKMQALEARLEACPKPVLTRPLQCRAETLRLQRLRADGKGPRHPEVLAAQKRIDACEAALPGDGK